MIINHDEVTVETNINTKKRTEFTIDSGQSAKLFKVLIESLYPNPVLATVTELSQNAWDAMARIGKDNIPIELTLPNYLSPEFVCRDYGESMTHEFVMDTYCSALKSSKDEDAEQAGGFGIGKFVALALSSTYTISCVQKGKKRIYSVFINGRGRPELSLVSNAPTDEKDGTEVRIPVLEKWFGAFPDAARRALRYYPTKPIIRGCPNFAYTEIRRTIVGSDWYIDANQTKPVAIGGIYWYEIEPNHISGLTEQEKTLLNSRFGLVMKFSPSDLSPQANRTGLYYNEFTVNNIRDRLKVVAREIRDSVQKEFDKCKSGLEARRLWSNYFSVSLGDCSASREIGMLLGNNNQFTWNGKEISDSLLHLVHIDKSKSDEKGNPVRHCVGSYENYALKWRRGFLRARSSGSSTSNLFVGNKIRFFVDDLERKTWISRRINDYLVSSPDLSKTTICLLTFPDANCLAKFHEMNGTTDADLEKLSSLPAPKLPVRAPRNPETVNRKHSLKVFKLVKELKPDCLASERWEPAEIDEDAGGIYTPMHRFQLVGFTSKMRCNFFDGIGILRHYDLHDSAKNPIYGIKMGSAPLARIEKNPKWTPLNKWVEQKLQEFETKLPNSDDVHLVKANSIIDSERMKIHDYNNLANKFPIPELLEVKRAVDEVEEARKKMTNFLKYETHHRALFFCPPNLQNSNTGKPIVATAIDKLTKKHPIVGYVDNVIRNSYICDKSGESKRILSIYFSNVLNLEKFKNKHEEILSG